jgi:hypothetical protein
VVVLLIAPSDFRTRFGGNCASAVDTQVALGTSESSSACASLSRTSDTPHDDSTRSSELHDELPSKIPCRYALLRLLVNLMKIRANAPIFSIHQKTLLRAAIFNRRNLPQRRRFQPSLTFVGDD